MGKAKTLRALWNRRIIDWLYINPVLIHQNITELAALNRILDHHGDDMAWVVDVRDTGGIQLSPQLGDLTFLCITLGGTLLEVRNGRCGGGCNCRGQRRGENKALRKAAQEIDHRDGTGDIAADASECLAQSAFDQGDTVHQAAFLSDTAAAWPVHAHCVDLIDIRHRAVLLADIKDFFDGGDIAVH